MYYHVLLETNEKIDKRGNFKQYFLLDQEKLSDIELEIVIPYLNENTFHFDGYFIEPKTVKRLVIKQSNKNTEELSRIENAKVPHNVVFVISQEDTFSIEKYFTNITRQVFKDNEKNNKSKDEEPILNKSITITQNMEQVFIVHGHDVAAKESTARFIQKIGFEPIILHEQPSSGSTIIEKIEQYSDVGFGVILYTPCDIGAKNEDNPNLNSRARQNVVFEHGYLVGKLGRKNVCALVKGNIEKPNDISGVVYTNMDDNGAWKYELANEMKNSGYDVDKNKI